MSADEFVVIQKHPDMLQYIDSLQRSNSDALGFLPSSVFEREQECGRLFLGLLRGWPCGYVYIGAIGEVVRCHQVCIQYDVRRRLYGAMLMSKVESHIQQLGGGGVQLRCGFDLDANKFWASIGYICVRIEAGGVRRMRKINVWHKQLALDLFGFAGIEPSQGSQDATVWKKHKKTGLITPFTRGHKLKTYQKIVKGEEE